MVYNVKVSSVDDIIELNRIMCSYGNMEFDITSDKGIVDGKSLLGMLYLASKEFHIHTMEGLEKNDFKERIQAFIKK